MKPALISVVILLGIGYCFWMLAREAGRIHDKLKAFKQRAVAARSRDELLEIRRELVVYANKECWHRHHSTHAREVLNYIDGRLNSSF